LYGSGQPLYRVPATGGEPVALTALDQTRHETEHAFPEFLPDGRHFLFLVRRRGLSPQVVAATLDTPGTRAVIVDDATHASVVGSQVVYARAGVLYAQPFDERTLAAQGQPIALAENLATTALTQGAFSAGGERVIAFENARRESAAVSQFTWYGRTGKRLGTVGEPAPYNPNFTITRDGRRFALLQDGDVWVLDAALGTRLRVTTDPALDNDPVLSPDGLQVMFDSLRRGTFDVFVKAIGAPGPESLVIGSDQQEFIEEWSPDGRHAILVQNNDLVALSLEDRTMVRLTNDNAHQDEPRFSPDGKWLAYSSDESGVAEIYIMGFPAAGIRRLVSPAGGVQPRWSGDGRELYYLTLDGTMMSVGIDPNTASPLGAAKPLFKTGLIFIRDIWDQYDVTNDGRFVVLEPVSAPEPGAITLLLNWRSDSEK